MDLKKQAIFEEIQTIVAETLSIDNMDELSLKAKFIEDLGADSLDVVELVMAFEEKLDISIPDEDAEKMATIEDALNWIIQQS